MTFYVENETEMSYDFSVEQIVRSVAEAVLEEEGCPYEVQVNVLLTDNEGIREFNRQYRQIDRETDVLSFPNLEYEQPGIFQIRPEQEADCFDLDSGELILGDIILSVDRIAGQAAEYGHSLRRELAFLVAHSMLHLCGYDHMEPEEAAVMERKQEKILTGLGITRDI
ncbi:MAG: rRNA maturation RNase YbeY [Acetatifactor sp.]|nr:rRNA maturation RNase YbeY [Acetatifactor sp.]